MNRLFRISLSGLLCLFAGCQQQVTAPLKAPRESVTGYVTLNGKPVQKAAIVFVNHSVSPVMKVRAEISQGMFLVPKGVGPGVGVNNVQIQPVVRDLEEFEALRREKPRKNISPVVVSIPATYQRESAFQVEVSEFPQNNDFEFHLTSK